MNNGQGQIGSSTWKENINYQQQTKLTRKGHSIESYSKKTKWLP